MRTLLALAAVVLLGAGGFWLASAPRPLAAGGLPRHAPDAANGKRVFDEAGCASCHIAPGAAAAERPVLAGGQSLPTPLGAIVVPNISPDRERGIGAWTAEEFASAVTRGVSPRGTHYVPAFPWTSYRNMTLPEVLDLHAYVLSLDPSPNAAAAEGLPFPFAWRRPVGIWKLLLSDPPPPPSAEPEVVRGHHIVVATGHCAECHTPRNILLATDMGRWLQGAPNPAGDGRVPPLAPAADGLKGWSASDIAYLLETGFTPDFDAVGGEMAKVVKNWSRAPAEDRAAVAAYLKALPAPAR